MLQMHAGNIICISVTDAVDITAAPLPGLNKSILRLPFPPLSVSAHKSAENPHHCLQSVFHLTI